MLSRSHPNLNISLIVCPSGVYFGTVWRLHKERSLKFWLCWRHTVPKLTADVHTNVEFWTSRETGPDPSQQPNQQPNQVRCLTKITRWHPKDTRRQNEDVNFYLDVYPKDTRRIHDGYTASYWEYDAFKQGHEGVMWPPDGINYKFTLFKLKSI